MKATAWEHYAWLCRLMPRRPARVPLTVATGLAAALSGDPPCSPSGERATGFPPYRFVSLICFNTVLNARHAIYGFHVLIFHFASLLCPFCGNVCYCVGS